MATFRSNLNSVQNTNALTVFGERLTTCFQKLWRHSDKNGQHNKIELQRKEKRFLYDLILTNTRSSEAKQSSLFNEKANNLLKDFNIKLKQLFKRKQRCEELINEVKSSEQSTVQIIGKLFSSTLITAAATTTTTTEQRVPQEGGIQQQQQQHHHHQQIRAIFSESEIMTIAENTFLAVRYENPDIDNEIRAILTANAQNGSTIAQIKDEYRKQTGNSFPIYGNITDFLLTIPRVTAECNENGTLYFNIKPSEKTKHIYDMVVSQNNRKTSSNENHSSSCGSSSNYVPNWRQRNQSMQPLQQRLFNVGEPPKSNENKRGSQPHSNDNQHHTFFPKPNRNPIADNKNNMNGVLTMAMASNRAEEHMHQQQQQQQQQWKHPLAALPPRVEANTQTPVLLEQSNWFFEDNLNYLNNRFKGATASHMNYVPVPMAALPPAHHPEQECFLQSGLLPPLPPIPQYRVLPTVDQILGRPSAASSDVNGHQTTTNREQYMTAGSSSPPSNSLRTTSNESLYTENSEYNARILDFPLLGDDFFLYMARMELKCKFKKFEKVLQSGLCVSGQTINAALKRLHKINPPQGTTIIVNIGSVDIMQGRHLVQIEHDFRQLISLMHSMCITPVLTTLAPLANHAHDQVIKEKLLRFNEFIKREGQFLTVIDIHTCLVNESGTLRFDCYQSQPRTVTGSKIAHVFWNKIGRQRVLQLIEANLEY